MRHPKRFYWSGRHQARGKIPPPSLLGIGSQTVLKVFKSLLDWNALNRHKTSALMSPVLSRKSE